MNNTSEQAGTKLLFGLPKQIWIINLAMMTSSIAMSFLWPINTIYMTSELGKSLVEAGIVMFFYFGCVAAGNMVGGRLFDKVGGYRSVVSAVIFTLVSIVLLNINNGWPAFPIIIMLIGFGQGIVTPIMYAMVGTSWPEGGRKAYNAGYVMQNLGFAIGTAFGAIAVSISFDASFKCLLLVYIVFLLLVTLGLRKIKTGKRVTKQVQYSDLFKNHSREMFSMLLLCIAFTLCWFSYVQWQGVVPVYTDTLGISTAQYSRFWTLNGILIVALQPIFMFFVKVTKIRIKTQVYIGLVIFMISFIMTANAQSYEEFLLCMGVLTAGEIMIWPAIPTIANAISPKGTEGFFQGITQTSSTIGKMFGPLIGSIIFTIGGFSAVFYALVGFMIVSVIAIYFHDKNFKIHVK